jgi:hypothetical protein
MTITSSTPPAVDAPPAQEQTQEEEGVAINTPKEEAVDALARTTSGVELSDRAVAIEISVGESPKQALTSIVEVC